MVMNDPVYFLMARIDLTGSSTGWHRAELIRSAIEHLGNGGRPYGLHEALDADRHTCQRVSDRYHQSVPADGRLGRLSAADLFVLVLRAAFRAVGEALTENEGQVQRAYLIWTLGAMLFGQVINFWSISLFDQSISFFYLILATIGAVGLTEVAVARDLLPGSRDLGTRDALAARGPIPRREGRVAGLPRPIRVPISRSTQSPSPRPGNKHAGTGTREWPTRFSR